MAGISAGINEQALWAGVSRDGDIAWMLLDAAGHIRAVNQACLQLPGVAALPLTGVPLDDVTGDGSTLRLKDGDELEITLDGHTYRIAIRALDQKDVAWCLRWQRDESADPDAVRLRAALDHMTARLMVADADDTIVFVNDALRRMFARHDKTLRRRYPGFDVTRLVGRNIAMFHRDPAHQHRTLRDCQGRISATITLAGLQMQLDAMPIRDAEGRYLGAFVIWDDIHAVHEAVRRISEGDLDVRLQPEHYEGAMRRLAELLNGMIAQVQMPLDDAITLATALADGDLTATSSQAGTGAFGRLQARLEDSIRALAAMIHELQGASRLVLETVAGLRAGGAELSVRTEQQAHLLRDASINVQEIIAGLATNCEVLATAAQDAAEINRESQAGCVIVSEVSAAVNAVAVDSRDISSVVREIDEIAFRTNLLALNAAVEAAHAGQHGRGFAIVAGEVRSLARRCTDHAQEIHRIAASSAQGVAQAQVLAAQAAQKLADITRAAQRIDEATSTAVGDARQRLRDVEDVGSMIATVDLHTGRNAVMAEESSRSAATLEELARHLHARAARFRTA